MGPMQFPDTLARLEPAYLVHTRDRNTTQHNVTTPSPGSHTTASIHWDASGCGLVSEEPIVPQHGLPHRPLAPGHRRLATEPRDRPPGSVVGTQPT